MANKKIAFIFPGQGAQCVGMGQSFARECGARKYFDEADRALGFSLSELCWNGDQKDLGLTYNAQPALLLTGYVAATLLKEKGITPDYVAGHSLGEYAALAFGGAFSLADGLCLVRKRGELMSKTVPAGVGKMSAILGLDKDTVLEIVNEASSEQEFAELANLNCPGQIVIGGHESAVLRASEIAKAKGARRAVVLDVSIPSHTSLMKPMTAEFKTVLDQLDVRPLSIPLVNNIEADIISQPEDIKRSLLSQLTSWVLWEESIRKLVSLGVDTFVEVGTGKVLSGLVRKVDRKLTVLNASDAPSLSNVCEKLS